MPRAARQLCVELIKTAMGNYHRSSAGEPVLPYTGGTPSSGTPNANGVHLKVTSHGTPSRMPIDFRYELEVDPSGVALTVTPDFVRIAASAIQDLQTSRLVPYFFSFLAHTMAHQRLQGIKTAYDVEDRFSGMFDPAADYFGYIVTLRAYGFGGAGVTPVAPNNQVFAALLSRPAPWPIFRTLAEKAGTFEEEQLARGPRRLARAISQELLLQGIPAGEGLMVSPAQGCFHVKVGGYQHSFEGDVATAVSEGRVRHQIIPLYQQFLSECNRRAREEDLLERNVGLIWRS